MITIKESESKGIFPTPWFFDRTERLRESVQDCSREELIDLVNHFQGFMDKYQGMLQTLNYELEEHLGYHDPLQK